MGSDSPKEVKPLRGIRQAGTTLVEILVVIVVFLVGILAVIQIFPRGLRVLEDTRTTAQVRSLTRSMTEQLKINSDQLPEDIFAVRYDSSGNILVDNRSFESLNLAAGDTVDASGILTDKDGNQIGDWLQNSGPNVAKHIYHEGKRVPAPRAVGDLYGGLMLLNYGPIKVIRDSSNVAINLTAVANDLSVGTGLPKDLLVDQSPVTDVTTKGVSDDARYVSTTQTVPASVFYMGSTSNGFAYLLLPTNVNFDRNYLIRVSAYIGSGAGFRRRDYLDLQVSVRKASDASKPLIRVPIQNILKNSGAFGVGESLLAVDTDSVKVAPAYQELGDTDFKNAVSAGNPYVYKVVDETLGALIFSPAAYDQVISRPDGSREPLLARVSYDVYDWRILHDEFRVPVDQQNSQYDYQLPVQSLKVGGQTGPDGRKLAGIFLESAAGSNPKADHMVLVDVETGATVDEIDGSGNVLVSVDKSRGVVTIKPAQDLQPNIDGLAARLRLPGKPTMGVDLKGRTLRVLYMARKEFAVQPIKTTSQFTLVYGDLSTTKPGHGQFSPGGAFADGSLATRLYFPVTDANRKVSIGTIYYRYKNDDPNTPPREISGQDFVIRYPAVNDGTGLPSVDIRDIDPQAVGLDDKYYGTPCKNVKGASLVVRAMWNPGSFTLTSDSTKNAKLIDQYSWNWRRSSTETYLQREDIR